MALDKSNPRKPIIRAAVVAQIKADDAPQQTSNELQRITLPNGTAQAPSNAASSDPSTNGTIARSEGSFAQRLAEKSEEYNNRVASKYSRDRYRYPYGYPPGHPMGPQAQQALKGIGSGIGGSGGGGEGAPDREPYRPPTDPANPNNFQANPFGPGGVTPGQGGMQNIAALDQQVGKVLGAETLAKVQASRNNAFDNGLYKFAVSSSVKAATGNTPAERQSQISSHITGTMERFNLNESMTATQNAKPTIFIFGRGDEVGKTFMQSDGEKGNFMDTLAKQGVQAMFLGAKAKGDTVTRNGQPEVLSANTPEYEMAQSLGKEMGQGEVFAVIMDGRGNTSTLNGIDEIIGDGKEAAVLGQLAELQELPDPKEAVAERPEEPQPQEVPTETADEVPTLPDAELSDLEIDDIWSNFA